MRHRRIAERLLGITGGTTMAEEAGDGESRFRRLADSFASDDFAGVLRELALMDRPAMASRIGELRLKLLIVWTGKEPGEASSFAGEGRVPSEACRVIASTWGKADSAAALSWARRLPDQSHRQEALIGVGSEVVFHNPRKAIELATEAGVNPGAGELLGQAAGAWARTDPEAAAAWAREVTDPALREKLVVEVASAWADRDPHAASKLVIDSVDEGILEENALVGILQRLAFQDMEGARDWVTQFPEGRMRERAEAELIRISGRLNGSPLTRQH